MTVEVFQVVKIVKNAIVDKKFCAAVNLYIKTVFNFDAIGKNYGEITEHRYTKVYDQD